MKRFILLWNFIKNPNQSLNKDWSLLSPKTFHNFDQRKKQTLEI